MAFLCHIEVFEVTFVTSIVTQASSYQAENCRGLICNIEGHRKFYDYAEDLRDTLLAYK